MGIMGRLAHFLWPPVELDTQPLKIILFALKLPNERQSEARAERGKWCENGKRIETE